MLGLHRNSSGELPDNFEEIFHSVDVDNSAEINYNEFVAAAMCRRITIDEEKLMLAFETLDLDNTGIAYSVCRRDECFVSYVWRGRKVCIMLCLLVVS